MKTLLELATEMDKLAAELPERVNTIKKEVAESILQDLSQETPADTGEAISNWQTTLDAPVSESIPPHVPSLRGKMIRGVWTHSVDPAITRAANAPITVDVGKAVIANAKPGQSIWITSVIPYIKRLNDGWSEQAPAGFVDRALILGRLIVDKFRKLR